MNSSKRLLLLDINGLLCCKVPKNQIIKNQEFIKLSTYNVIVRPGCRKFLKSCYLNFDVGFLSSTTEYNATIILKKLLTPQQHKLTVCFLFREFCRADPDPINTFDTIKVLQDVFDDDTLNKNNQWNDTNTILIDDSITKTRFNDPVNILICKSYTGEKSDTTLYGLHKLILMNFQQI